MATISKLPSGKYQAKVRRTGFRTVSKTFLDRRSAQAWARKAESEVERSVYIDTTDARSLRLSVVLDRYSSEVAVTHKGWRQEQSRFKGLRERIGAKIFFPSPHPYWPNIGR